MTKVIILGQEPKELTGNRKIEFVKWIDSYVGGLEKCISAQTPNCYDNIELIRFGTNGRYDIMFAYNTERSKGVLFLGHFNDGII